MPCKWGTHTDSRDASVHSIYCSPKMSQHSYLRNIAAFLQACKKQFNLQDLFVESDLYEVDNFKKVMQVLSRLSHSPQALSLGWV